MSAILQASRELIAATGYAATTTNHIAALDPSRPFEDLLRDLFLHLVDLHSASPRLHRVLAEEAPHMRRSRRKHRHAPDDDHEALAVARLLEARPGIRVQHPLAAAHVLEQATEALTYWLVHEAPSSLDREAYVDEAVALLSAYVTGNGGYNPQRR